MVCSPLASASVPPVYPIHAWGSGLTSGLWFNANQACSDYVGKLNATVFNGAILYTLQDCPTTGSTNPWFGTILVTDFLNGSSWITQFYIAYLNTPICPKDTGPNPNPLTGMCDSTCSAGFVPDPSGAGCVPDCTVDDLPPITDPEVQAFEDNPDLSDTADLTPRMQTGLSCLLTAAASGSPTVGSAYRPPAYNQHLIDVWEKWVNELQENTEPGCMALKTKIHKHFLKHKLLETQPPVPGSLHTKGEAVDVTISLPAANIDVLAAGCQLRRSVPVKDPVHFVHQ